MKRKVIAMLAIITLFTAGCTKEEEPVADKETVEEEPVSMESVDAAESSIAMENESLEPTEPPTPTPNPYEIGGMDFQYYFDRDLYWGIGDVTEKYEFEHLRIIVINNFAYGKMHELNPITVIDDGDKYTLLRDPEKEYDTQLNTYIFAVYTPKAFKEWNLKGEDEEEAFYNSDFWYQNWNNGSYEKHLLPAYFYVNRTKNGEDRELQDAEFSISVVYEDDTEETITVYFTKEYLLSY